MKLLTIFNQLSYGELSQLALGNSEGAGIQRTDWPMLIDHINIGLLELHKRFDIKRKNLVIEQYEQIQLYILDRRFAKTNVESLEPIKYIDDSEYDPFDDEVLKIERVFDELGIEYPLNDDVAYNSLHTPQTNAIQVPLTFVDNTFYVEYRASHKLIDRYVDPKETEVDLPLVYLEALLSYVASRAHSPFASQTNQESQTYMMKFEAACAKITEMAITQANNTTNLKPIRNGWV